MIEAGQVANLIVKDASRLGREYLQVGYYMEIYFPQKNVRFIAVNDGVDSTVESSNDFNPIRNWANELHAKDTSRKVRAVMKMKAEQGERLGGRPPYGYRKSDGDANTLVPDEDTAPVVKRIFSLCAAGNGPKRIATILTKEQVVNPSNAYYRKTGKSHRGLDTTRPCLWSSNSVTSILNNEVYLGHSVGLRTTTISYKNKQRVERPESERFVVKNTHEALVTQEQWDIVQEVRQHKKRVPKHMDEPNIFSGLVFCADCGKPLVLHRASTMKKAEYNFKCYTYGKKGKTVCTPHHIREFELKAVVLEDLRRVTHFARMKEKQFAAYISSKNTLELRREMNTIQKDLDTMRRRREELSKLFKRLYEDNVLGRVTDEQYRMLAGDYTVEQKALEEQIPEKKALLEKLKNFLEDMQWEGFANMDIKYDARTGEYKMFEMNPRQGRSSYFVTAAGYNLSKWLGEDVLEHKELGLTIADTKSLWMIAPYGVIKKYLKDPDLLARADKLKKEGKCAHQLFCKEDWNLKRWLWYIRSQLNYYRKTARYYGNKGLRD